MAYQPIDNKTVLNTTLFTYISSGGPDYYLKHETSDNDQPWDILKHAYDHIPNGDRYTLSFSLTRFGNKPKDVHGDVYRSPRASLWGVGNVHNLEAYFENYPDDKVLYFQFYIYKPTTYQYFIDLEVIDPDVIEYFIPKQSTGLLDKVDQIFICYEPTQFWSSESYIIQDNNNLTILCDGVL